MATEPSSVAVTPLRPEDRDRGATVLGRAFTDDPLWRAIMPDPATRTAKLTRLFGALMRTVDAAGGLMTTVDLGAVALWGPPGRTIGVRSMLRSRLALMRSMMTLPADDRKRMLPVLRQTDARRKELVPDPHWYLHVIGTDPDRQGQGLGTVLVRDGLRRADEAGTATYLETETESNVSFYEQLGFEVVEELRAEGLDLPLWLMLRRPDAPTA